VTVTGTGTIVLNALQDTFGVLRPGTYSASTWTLTLGSGQTVEGVGLITGDPPVFNNPSDVLGVVDNQGLILANQSGGTLTIGPAVTNDGTMEVTNGGTLDISGVTNDNTIEANGGTVAVIGGLNQNANGVVEALSGSTVALEGGGTISSGTLIAQDGGVFGTASGQGGTLDNVTIAAGTTYTAGDGSSTGLADTITNDGTIAFSSTGDPTSIAHAQQQHRRLRGLRHQPQRNDVGRSQGAVGLEWQVGGIAADPPTGPPAASMAQLIQAMASFGANAAVNSAPGPFSAAPTRRSKRS
jgi:hypothetical protein